MKTAGFLFVVALAMAATLTQAKLEDVVKLCNTNKDRCLSFPSGCLTSNNCTAAVYVDPDTQDVSIASATDIPEQTYAAVGFSLDKEMGDEVVTICVQKNDNSTKLLKGYNVGHSPTILLDDVEGLTTKSAAGFQCTFSNDGTTQAGNSTFVTNEGDAYYLLLAVGAYNEEGNKLGFHHDDYVISEKTIAFNSSALALLAPSAILAIIFARML